MRRYEVKINDALHVIDVEEVGHDSYTVHLDQGRVVDVTLAEHQDLSQTAVTPAVEIGGVRAQPVETPEPKPQPVFRPLSVRTPPRPRPMASNAVTAPMPGTVLSVEVSAGSVVARGTPLLVLEAMKMKNEVRAEREGVVARVMVGVGDQVKHGDLLVEFEG